MRRSVAIRFRVRIIALALLTSLALAWLGTTAFSADYTWDVTSGDGAAITDGPGAWSDGGGDWNSGVSPFDAVWTNNAATPDNAIFGGGTSGVAGTVTLGGTIDVDNITFNAPAAGTYRLTGGTLNLGGSDATSPTITANVDAAIDSALTGSNGLIVGGSGTLTLTNTNSYSGATTINAGGTLQIGNGGSSGTLGAGAINDNGALVFNRSDAALALTTANVIGGSGSVTIDGGGTVTLGNVAQTYTGGTIVNSGTLALTNGGTGVGAIRGALTIDSGGLVALRGPGDDFGFSNAATTLSTLNINGGTLDIQSSPGETLTGVTINFNGGTMRATDGGRYVFFDNGYGSTSINTSASAQTASISTLTWLRQSNTVFTVAAGTTPSGIDFSLAGDVTEVVVVGASLTKNGAGVMAMSGAGSYTGATTIGAGTLRLSTGGSLGNTAIDVAGGAIFHPVSGTFAGTTATAGAGASLALADGATLDLTDGKIGMFSLNQNASFAAPALTLDGGTLNFDLGVTGSDTLAVSTGALRHGNEHGQHHHARSESQQRNLQPAHGGRWFDRHVSIFEQFDDRTSHSGQHHLHAQPRQRRHRRATRRDRGRGRPGDGLLEGIAVEFLERGRGRVEQLDRRRGRNN